uniref:Caspase recruitment domain family member 14 n=1 Tax=Myripristis murdjan TaxID=586833 RepID=A0A667XWH8_9TELE
MAGECVPEGRDVKEMDEEELWELINDNRHRICLGVQPCMLIPYLRQARVLSEVDEDEILTCPSLANRSMRTSHMLDLLRTQGRNGAVALLESLMIHYPNLYTQVTGRKPSAEPSRFSGLIKYSELTEYLVRAVTGMQKELHEARQEAQRFKLRCVTLESEISQVMEQEEKSRCLQTDCERMRRHLAAAHREVNKLKDEKCDFFVRYTAAIEEKSAVNIRCRDLNLQVRIPNLRLIEYKLMPFTGSAHSTLLPPPPLLPVNIVCQILCIDKTFMKFLQPCQVDICIYFQLLDQKECLSLQVEKLTLDCDMYQQKSTVIQSQMRDLQAERDQAYLSRDEAQAQIARSLAEKDILRCQLVELQEKVFTLRTRGGHRDWESQGSSSEECSTPPRPRLRRMQAINPASLSSCNSEVCASVCNSDRRFQWPLSVLSVEEHFCVSLQETVILTIVKMIDETFMCHSSVLSLSRTSAPPFLMRSRPKAIRITGRVVTISFQGEALLSQLTVVGGNRTGVFVHQVTEGTAAHSVGISPGAQIAYIWLVNISPCLTPQTPIFP